MNDQPGAPPDEAIQRAITVQEKYRAWLLTLPHVVGVAVGMVHSGDVDEDEVGVVVLCEADDAIEAPVSQMLPARLDGVAIGVQALGPFSAFAADG